MLLKGMMAVLAVTLAATSQPRAAEPEMWAPRSDVAACQRVDAPEEAAQLFGISLFEEDYVTRIRMTDGEEIWTFFVPASTLPRQVRRAAQVSWPRGFLVFEARNTEQDCLQSAQGVFADLGIPRRLMRRQSSIP